MEPFVARPARGRIALLAAGSLLFVLLGLWMAGLFGEPPRPGREWIGWVAALFFAVVGVGWALRLRESAPQIVIDDAGISARQWSEEHIPWSAVRDIGERRVRNQTFFSVQLKDVDDHPPARLLGRISAAQAGMGMGHFALSATGTDRSADELRDALACFAPEEFP